ncbi:hypothetical protein RE6C_04767 [Rhodopirellula europaea 6C]|uniref:Uncharacterized protein n=1 Tax=Rhodopirellula europaea 6C TaxID=1263867 RepID=M2AC10_9BACT|nr:hypothetical protein RE6C_04767 [Rhodopirellula europaea 6C]
MQLGDRPFAALSSHDPPNDVTEYFSSNRLKIADFYSESKIIF